MVAAPTQPPPGSDFRTHWRILLAVVAVGVVVPLSGGGRSLSDGVEWAVESLLGAVIGIVFARLVVPQDWYVTRFWAALLTIATAVTLPLTAVVLGFRVLHHTALTPGLVLNVIPAVALISVVMTGLAFLVRGHAIATHAAAPGAPPAKFLARLPERLRGADLYAVEAEDHYLRLHTSAGQDLILMRLGDAIAELEGLEGAQTHRSWWVARSAVASAERFEGRATLTLKDGAEVPVSRGFARALRQAGWF